jgi:type IV pilus assembly protein PilX
MKHGKHAQQGVVLVVTLIVLVAMTLAGIALMRSVDTSTVIAGNLAFRQSATASGDQAVEAAIDWLRTHTGGLEQDAANSGYYATSQDALDLTGNKTPEQHDDDLDWSGNGVTVLAKDDVGNQVSYVIHRMCNSPGPLNGATCATDLEAQAGGSSGSSRQMLTYQPGGWWEDLATRGYYRITARVTGPRNTISYIQAVVSI